MVFRNDDPKASLYPNMQAYTAFLKKMERPLVGRENEMKQLMAAMCRPELCNAILLAEAGSGKCQILETILPVADERGYITFADVKVGDKVFNENGEPSTVIGVFPQGKKHAYKVVFEDGTSTICNDEHLWAARTRWHHYENYSYEVHTLREMMDYGIVRTIKRKSRSYDAKSWYIPRNKAVQRPSADLPIHPYALGVLIGDGCLTCQGALEISSNDEDLVQHVADLIGAVDVEKRKDNYTWYFLKSPRKDYHNVSFIQVHELADKLSGEKVFGYKSIERRIPRSYMLGSIEQRMELLRGLMDTDGTTMGSDGRVNVSFSTNSEGLADDVRELAASLGYRTTLHIEERHEEVHENLEYEVYFKVSDDEASDLFWLPRHKDKIAANRRTDKRFNRHYDDIAIAEVIDLGREEEMVCIYVDTPSHLYQVGKEHIVTHNTALVQGMMEHDQERVYLEVDLPRMISNLKNENEMADKLKQLFNEVEKYRKTEGREIVLFIDEFHQIVQLSPAAVEVLKPLLADSGTRGIRVIAATTYLEFQEYIAKNLPLVERLQRINLPQPNKDVVVSILKGMAERYGVGSQFRNNAMFEAIYDYTNRYIPANAQPRKSILIMDSMIGWHRLTKKPIDMKMLADVIYETEGINIAFRVDATTIKKELDKRVLSQDFATSSIENRLQICCADLNNKNKPMSSFLFTGSTGTGKGIWDEVLIPVYTSDGTTVLKRNGDLVVGDYVFNRKGIPVMVTGVYHRGLKDVYKVTLSDGRSLIVDGSHLWTWQYAKGHESEGFVTTNTEDLIRRGLYRHERNGRKSARIWIPMNEAVQYPERQYGLHPYVLGALLGNGCLTLEPALVLSSGNNYVPEKLGRLLHTLGAVQSEKNYNWLFVTNFVTGPRGGKTNRYLRRDDALASVPELIGLKSHEKFIPDMYKWGSVEQRWQLIQGLFDTDGSIGSSDGDRFNVSYSTTSKRLADDIQQILFSLGIASSIRSDGDRGRDGDVHDLYSIHVKIENDRKELFFSYPKKRDLAIKAKGAAKQRYKTYDLVAITSIEKLDEQLPTTCIMVDDDEHLYQAGDFIVTHNTECSKQLANILFEDERALIRMDMTEYALPESLERFRQELTQAVWTRPYCIVLLDEIEKACGPVTRLLLQVLDDGRLIDRNNREVTFKNAYIIVTTNAGSEIYKTIAQYNVDDTGSGKMMEKYDALIKDSIKGESGSKFPPELLGRIDCLVPFQPLSETTMRNICKSRLAKLAGEIKMKHGLSTQFEERVVEYVVANKLTMDSDAGGARAVVSKIENEVTVAISKFINSHPNYRDGKTIYVGVDGILASEHKDVLETEAKIVVSDKPMERKKANSN